MPSIMPGSKSQSKNRDRRVLEEHLKVGKINQRSWREKGEGGSGELTPGGRLGKICKIEQWELGDYSGCWLDSNSNDEMRQGPRGLLTVVSSAEPKSRDKEIVGRGGGSPSYGRGKQWRERSVVG